MVTLFNVLYMKNKNEHLLYSMSSPSPPGGHHNIRHNMQKIKTFYNYSTDPTKCEATDEV